MSARINKNGGTEGELAGEASVWRGQRRKMGIRITKNGYDIEE
jgi:hypothetical protein